MEIESRPATRYFGFWCNKCPTRVSVETESDKPDAQPYYGEQECPSCFDGKLVDTDILCGSSEIPYHDEKDSAQVHAEWLKKRNASD